MMKLGPNGLTIYRLTPEEVERYLADKYGGKIAAVNLARLARQSLKMDKIC